MDKQTGSTNDLLSAEDFMNAENAIELNFGKKYAPEKYSLLWDSVKSLDWSRSKFQVTLSLFLARQKYRDWTIADFLECSMKLYPLAWFYKKKAMGQACEDEYTFYIINKSVMCRPNDGIELPYPRFEFPAHANYAPCPELSDEERWKVREVLRNWKSIQ